MIKTKKIIPVIMCIVLSVVALSGIYYIGIYNRIKEVNVKANFLTFETIEELSEEADLIVIASTNQNIEERKTISKVDNQGFLYDIHTLSDIEIKKIIKTNNNKLAEKTNIAIIEPVGLIQEFDGKKLIKYDNYEPLEVDTPYLLFLKANNEGVYTIINLNNGKFNLDGTETIMDKSHEAFYKDIQSFYGFDIIEKQ